MKVVVTGATGLIGRHLLPALASQYEVWALSRSAPREAAAVARGAADRAVTWIAADFARVDLPDDLPGAADVVIHLAQSPHYAEFPEHALDVFAVNVASTARLLDWSRRAGVRHFILASSGGVATADARSYYLQSKQAAEGLATAYSGLFSVLALRFFFVYGRGQRPTMLVPRLVAAVASGHDVTLAEPDGPRLNPIHVSDAVAAVLAAIDRHESGCIDVAGPEPITVREMCELIGRAIGRAPRYAMVPGPAADLLGDISEMRARLIAPARRFADGVADMIAQGG